MIQTRTGKAKRVRKVIVIVVVAFSTLLFAVSCINDASGAFLSVNREQCTGCGECSTVCATTAIRIIDNKAVIDPAECVECGKCVEICNWNAIQ